MVCDLQRLECFRTDILDAIGPRESDFATGTHEAFQMGINVVGCAVNAFEGVKNAIAAMDQMVVGGNQHEQGICDDSAQHAGVHGVKLVVPRLAQRLELFNVGAAINAFQFRISLLCAFFIDLRGTFGNIINLLVVFTGYHFVGHFTVRVFL